MSNGTPIEWTRPPGYRSATWNPTKGCKPKSAGCKNCYAMKMAARIVRMGGPAAAKYLPTVKSGPDGKARGQWSGVIVEDSDVLDLPLRTRKPTCYFVNSMSDLFDPGVSDEFIGAVFSEMAACPHHRFQILTKSGDRMAAWFKWIEAKAAAWAAQIGRPFTAGQVLNLWHLQRVARGAPGTGNPGLPWPLPNVHIGVSVEDADNVYRIDQIRDVPAALRFISFEPLLADVGRVDLRGIGWAIIGGESGGGARPFDLEWCRHILRQCKAAGVARFVKQLGKVPVMSEAEWRAMAVTPLLRPSNRKLAPAGTVPLALADRNKGAAMAQWPADLQVREYPDEASRVV